MFLDGEPGFPLMRPRYSGAVSPPGKKTARSAEEWLLNGSEQTKSTDPKANGSSLGSPVPEERKLKSLPGEPIGTETAQWASDPGTATETSARSENGADADLSRENRELAKRIREMQTELRTQEKEANERLEQATVDLVKKHDSREQRLTTAFERQRDELIKAFEKQLDELKKTSETSESELRARIDDLSSKLAKSQEAAEAAKEASSKRRGTGGKKARRPGGKDGAVDLNEASFEELRGLGLSVTQSARVIAYRDVRSGFESLEELDEIPGLSKQTRMDLRNRLTLSS